MSRVSTSIAIATFNGAAYLEEQLQSFLAQTCLPDELVVCDDGSSDATFDLLRHFAKTAPFKVRIFANEQNLGYAQNFSKALSLCEGDIVFLSDQDDVWLPEKIEKMLAGFAIDPDAQLLIHDLEFCKADLTPIGQTKIQRMRGLFDLDSQYVVGMATAIRKDFLSLCLPVPNDPMASHDYWLHACANAIKGKHILHEVLALYRRHPSSATSTGSMNVDFVTTSDHFRRGRLAGWMRPLDKKRLAESRFPVLHDWLQSKKNELIHGGYVCAGRVDEISTLELRRLENIDARLRLLDKGRIERVAAAIILWSRGGYRNFNGWKSLVKDILLT